MGRPRLVVTSPFGWRIHPTTGQRSFHAGVDIALPEGTPLKAPIAGQLHRWTDPNSGHAIAIHGWLHGQPARVVYAHLAGWTQTPPIVPAGTVIALSGRTGRVTGPHTHVQVWMNGRPVDPLQVLDLSAYEIVLPHPSRPAPGDG